jgi:hypothetical protein
LQWRGVGPGTAISGLWDVGAAFAMADHGVRAVTYRFASNPKAGEASR